MPGLSIHLLGDFRLLWDGAPISSVKTARLQSLLAYLVLHRTAAQSRHHLAFLFWPDSTEAQALGNLRKLLFDLRHALPEVEQFLAADTRTVQWRTEVSLSLDIADFQAALVRADHAEKTGNPTALRAALEEAVSLYGGDLVPSCYDDWIVSERDRLSLIFVDTLERLVLLLEDLRDYRAAIASAQSLLRHDPLHEATYRRMMRLQALAGDRPAALRTYHTCATILQRELGVEPGAATQEAYQRLVQTEAMPRPIPLSPAGQVPLVGREREWAQLQAVWRAAAAGGPRLVFLTGEAGIGKTRLAEELLAWAARQSIAVACARSYAGEWSLAFAPVIAWLRARSIPPLDDVWRSEIARLLPELQASRPDLPSPGPLTEPWQRRRLFEALARAMLGGAQPLLLVLDDLHWCDQDTLDWLLFLLEFDPRARLLLVGTSRSGEVPAGHPLLTLLANLRRNDHLVEIELDALTEAESFSLARQLADRELDQALTTHLYQGSEGNPLFLVEMIRMLGRREATWSVEHGPRMVQMALPLSPKVRIVIEARLAQLSPPARELAELAATLGRQFTFAELVQAGERDENGLVQGLDELWRRRIVREQGADAYDFSHDKIREVAYAGLSSARRRLLHRQVGRSLEAAHAGNLDAVSLRVATHYEQAGLPEQAVPYYQQAAEVARRVFANQEAMDCYRRALALLEALPESGAQSARWTETSVRLHEGQADVLALAHQAEEARLAYQRALALISTQDARAAARLQRKIGNAWRDQLRYQEASSAYQQAEAALGPEPEATDQDWYQEWIQIQLEHIWNFYWHGQEFDLAERVQQIQALVERHGTMAQRAMFFHSLALLGCQRERYALSEKTVRHAQAALEASLQTGDPQQLVAKQFVVGFAHLWHGDLAEAEPHLMASYALTEQIGDVVWRTRCLAYLSVLHRLRGETEATQQYASLCLEAATAHHIDEYLGLAQANLAWLAWRRGSWDEGLAIGRDALESWDRVPIVFPFRWLAVWPMMGITLAQGNVDQALGYARIMIGPAQQPLPEALEIALHDALEARRADQAEAARSRLERAFAEAQALGTV